jgi:hypothetical protein
MPIQYPVEMQDAKDALEEGARTAEMKGYAVTAVTEPTDEPAWVATVMITCVKLTVTKRGRQSRSLAFRRPNRFGGDRDGRVVVEVDGAPHPDPLLRGEIAVGNVGAITAWFVGEYLDDTD